ncbi:MAG: HlyD family efflux transporter periplasmic adaptor subunit [Saprospiraceae bacterium]|nr:HlyD family efflux transporter periplasmic adaptor subunit [Saprospiraceae bacterium]
MRYTILLLTSVVLVLSACQPNEKNFDASGNFETVERTISAEASGKIQRLDIEEGMILKAGDTIGKIDVKNLQLQAEQILASISAIEQKTNEAEPQIDILKAQLQTQQAQVASLEQQMTVLEKEVQRFRNLAKAKAVPQKQLDDLEGQQAVLQKQLNVANKQIGVIESQIASAKKSTRIQNRAILSEKLPTQKRLALIEEQISDGYIINDYPGTVTTQFAYDGEFTATGKPLYRIADLSEMTLRVYISGDQLGQIKLNDTVTVLTDDGQGGMHEDQGRISWISSKAEFTPKTIQTKDERANKVYAVKVKVKNDGTYKMGMYGQIKFRNDE